MLIKTHTLNMLPVLNPKCYDGPEHLRRSRRNRISIRNINIMDARKRTRRSIQGEGRRRRRSRRTSITYVPGKPTITGIPIKLFSDITQRFIDRIGSKFGIIMYEYGIFVQKGPCRFLLSLSRKIT